jgi:hypothetical protein
MPKRKKRGNITIIQMHGHPIQTGLKSNTILISLGSFDTDESNKRCCPRGHGYGWPRPGPPAEPPRGEKSNTPQSITNSAISSAVDIVESPVLVMQIIPDFLVFPPSQLYKFGARSLDALPCSQEESQNFAMPPFPGATLDSSAGTEKLLILIV